MRNQIKLILIVFLIFLFPIFIFIIQKHSSERFKLLLVFSENDIRSEAQYGDKNDFTQKSKKLNETALSTNNLK